MERAGSNGYVRHTETGILVGCIDGRLGLPHAWRTTRFSWPWQSGPWVESDFLAGAPGGGAALLIPDLRPAIVDAILTAIQLRQVRNVVLELHAGCGKLAVLKNSDTWFKRPSGRMEWWRSFDLDDPLVLLDVGDAACSVLLAALRQSGLEVMPGVRVEVVSIQRGWFGLPAARIEASRQYHPDGP